MDPSTIEVEVQIDDPFAGQADPDSLERCARATLRHQRVGGPGALTIVVTGDGNVRRLNRAYRGVDATTDVLAFGDAEGDGFVTAPGAPRYLGDVIISLPRAEAQAGCAGHPLEAELQLLTVHGVLHLLGHDHAEPAEKTAMWAAQAEILRALGAPVADPTPEETDTDSHGFHA
jgi:probable rRNA maturation factor